MALGYKGMDFCLQRYVDSDWASDMDSSTIGYIFTLGSATVSCVSKLQKIVTLSTIEVRYVAATEACKELI